MTGKKLVVANWKMNPQSVKEAELLFGGVEKGVSGMKNAKVVVCPPFVYLDRLSQNPKLSLGTQDFFWERDGAYTGEISISMLKNLGVKYAIVGHSERRNLGETDETINQKIRAALKNNLKVLFCVGEKERDEGADCLKFVKKQIVEGLRKVSRKDLRNLLFVYEPVWAISSNKNAQADTPENFLQTSIYIRRTLFFKFGLGVVHQIPILYGGSVDFSNVNGFLERGKADGILVGRASWRADDFNKLLKNVA